MTDGEKVTAFALTLPGAEASTSYRQPGIKIDGKTKLVKRKAYGDRP